MRIFPNDECFKDYIKELENEDLVPILSHEEIINYGRLSWKGDIQARNLLLLSHLRFVVSIAKNFTKRGLPMSELVCWGNFALIETLESYNPDHISKDGEKKGPFLLTTYAQPRIEKCLRDALKEWNSAYTKTEKKMQRIPSTFEKMYNSLYEDLNEGRSDDQKKIEPFEWLKVIDLDESKYSDDSEGETNESFVPSEIPDPSVLVSDEDAKVDLRKIIDETLSDDERLFIELAFGFGNDGKCMNEWDIAKQYGYDLLTVAKTINRAKVKLYKNMKIRELRGCISK